MLLSRAKPGSTGSTDEKLKAGSARGPKKIPELEEFLNQRDYSGAIALIEFQKSTGKGSEVTNSLWLAYCYFHSGNFESALKIYKDLASGNLLPRRKNSGMPSLGDKRKSIVEGAVNLLKGSKSKTSQNEDSITVTADDVWLYVSCCHFFLGEYDEAAEAIKKVGSESSLKTRLDLHLAHKKGNESQLMEQHEVLKDILEDQLCLASVHYLRAHYQDAIDIYKKILVENRTFLALNVFVALCYYKLDYYDVSQEVLAMYLTKFPDSVTAVNIKACNHYRLYNGKAAEAELRTLLDSASSSFTFAKDLIRHNLVVFRGGEGALQVLPSLLPILPEARLNLVIYHLRQGNLTEASDLMASIEPSVANEYILKAIVNALQGQKTGDRDALKMAQQNFQLVGGSASECDTIPGRQCMASCFFLLKQFEDVLLYLSSIKSYFYNDDHFNFNYAQAKIATGNYKEAMELLTNISSPAVRSEPVFAACLIRSYVMTKRMDEAWNVYTMASKDGQTSGQSFNLLTMIANDCYKMGLFLDSLKAFSLLEKLDSTSSPAEYWEGKRGAACGHFQSVVAGKETIESLRDVIKLIASPSAAKSAQTSQADHIVGVIRKWMSEHQNQSRDIKDDMKI